MALRDRISCQRERSLPAAPLLGDCRPGTLDEDIVHRAGRGHEEVLAVLPIELSTRSEKAEINLVHECGRLDRIGRSDVIDLPSRPKPEFVSHEPKEPIDRLGGA